MKKKLPTLLLLAAALLCGAQQNDPLKIYYAPRINPQATPGNMTRADFWKDVRDSSPFVLNVPAAGKTQRAVFRAFYNRTHLFVRVDADEPLADRLDFDRAAPRRDSAEVFGPAHVEFFLDTELLRKSAAQVVASHDGGIYDAIVCGGTKAWRYDAAVRGTRSPRGWLLHVAFPFKDKGVDVVNVFGMLPGSDPVIGFNACRCASIDGSAKAVQWSKTPDNSYDRPDRYGLLVFSGEKDSFKVLQGFLAGAGAGAMTLEGNVSNAGAIYRLAIGNALTIAEINARMLPEPRKGQIIEELHALGKKAQAAEAAQDDQELSRILGRCGALNAEIAARQVDLEDSLLDEI